MDAATHYVIVTMSDGTQKTSTVGEPTWQACWAHVEMLKDVKRTDPTAPIISYRCELHDPKFGLMICEPRGRQCENFKPKSRQGCTALKWVVRMRDRGHTADCYEHPDPEVNDRFEKGWSE